MNTVYLVASGDLRASANQKCEAAQAAMEKQITAALEKAKPAGEWLLLNSSTGPRAIRLQQLKAAEPASYEAIKDRVLQDWKDDAMMMNLWTWSTLLLATLNTM